MTHLNEQRKYKYTASICEMKIIVTPIIMVRQVSKIQHNFKLAYFCLENYCLNKYKTKRVEI